MAQLYTFHASWVLLITHQCRFLDCGIGPGHFYVCVSETLQIRALSMLVLCADLCCYIGIAGIRCPFFFLQRDGL